MRCSLSSSPPHAQLARRCSNTQPPDPSVRTAGVDSSPDTAAVRACGDPLATWRAIDIQAEKCPRCRRRRSAIEHARAIGAYDGPLRAIVHALKYEGRRSLAPRLAAMMRARGSEVLAGSFCVVPVPLHPRGGASAVSIRPPILRRRLDRPVLNALRRVRATPSQAALPAARRHQNVREAFAADSCGAATPGRDRGAGRRCEHDGRDAGGVCASAQSGRGRARSVRLRPLES